tara:strand:- start:387 stop:599 length:213 start_codon:yes stop_codon:yes gene_type:complete
MGFLGVKVLLSQTVSGNAGRLTHDRCLVQQHAGTNQEETASATRSNASPTAKENNTTPTEKSRGAINICT